MTFQNEISKIAIKPEIIREYHCVGEYNLLVEVSINIKRPVNIRGLSADMPEALDIIRPLS